MNGIPRMERAVQVVAPDTLALNSAKPVPAPGPHQLLARVEAVGLCFSDLKLLKQFSGHARKSEIVTGLDAAALAEMPHYVPGETPTVPGHEAVVRIVDVGPGVADYAAGERFLVQTDYRWLPTGKSNAAFGYNFEGALQEYVLFDERVIAMPDGESTLIPVPEDLAASAIALVEPWACVENAYAEVQRRRAKTGGRVLVVGDDAGSRATLAEFVAPAATVVFGSLSDLDSVATGTFDDIVYFGADAAMVEALFPRLAAGGLMVLVQGGGRFGRPIDSQIGRVHYGGIRVVGTPGGDLADALAAIPETVEIRPGDAIDIIGAAGPMGTMHVVRALCQGVAGVTVHAGDLNDERLAGLAALSAPIAARNRVAFSCYNPKTNPPAGPFGYTVLMVPVPALIGPAITKAAPGGIINIFAGIPAEATAAIDLDAYVGKRLYFVGTSGSELKDMKVVLSKVLSRELDTNLSVAAVTGLDGAIEGIRAVEKNLVLGKILVYPACTGLGLTGLGDLPADVIDHGARWTIETEAALLKRYAK